MKKHYVLFSFIIALFMMIFQQDASASQSLFYVPPNPLIPQNPNNQMCYTLCDAKKAKSLAGCNESFFDDTGSTTTAYGRTANLNACYNSVYRSRQSCYEDCMDGGTIMLPWQ
jgi:hypothetical protein